jgi:hypothetical protein
MIAMAMDWYHYLKRYIWDERKTPFFIAVGKLDKGQANSEIFLYALFLSVPGALVVAAALADIVRNGNLDSIWPGLYAASVCVAAALLRVKKTMAAAYYSITVPVSLLAYLYFMGFHPKLGMIDQILLVAVLLLWLRYTVRVAAIAKAYSGMLEKPETEK